MLDAGGGRCATIAAHQPQAVTEAAGDRLATIPATYKASSHVWWQAVMPEQTVALQVGSTAIVFGYA